MKLIVDDVVNVQTKVVEVVDEIKRNKITGNCKKNIVNEQIRKRVH